MLLVESSRMLRKILSLGSNCNFIEAYDNVLTDDECSWMIQEFARRETTPGICYSEGKPTSTGGKKSIDVVNPMFNDGTKTSKILHTKLSDCLWKYREKYPSLRETGHWGIDNAYNLQKYEHDDDGFNTWHCEHGPHPIAWNRIMAWMFYLNDAKGTDFRYFSTVKAKKGRCVIWPAFWTHTHRSQSNKGLKYLATGWISYKCK